MPFKGLSGPSDHHPSLPILSAIQLVVVCTSHPSCLSAFVLADPPAWNAFFKKKN